MYVIQIFIVVKTYFVWRKLLECTQYYIPNRQVWISTGYMSYPSVSLLTSLSPSDTSKFPIDNYRISPRQSLCRMKLTGESDIGYTVLVSRGAVGSL